MFASADDGATEHRISRPEPWPVIRPASTRSTSLCQRDSDPGYHRPFMPDHPDTTRAAPEQMVRARGLSKRFGEFTAVDGIDFEVAPRRGLRVPRAQRLRQDLDDADDQLRLAAERWRAAGPRDGARDRWTAVRDSGSCRRTTRWTWSSPSRRTSGFSRYFDLPYSVARARAALLEFVQLQERAKARSSRSRAA